MSLLDVKTLVSGNEEQLSTIYRQTEKRLLGMLKRSLTSLLVVPDELDYVVDEVTIARFNRIGSEGMSSESVEGRSANYNDNYFVGFADDIQRYIDSQLNPDGASQLGKVRFV